MSPRLCVYCGHRGYANLSAACPMHSDLLTIDPHRPEYWRRQWPCGPARIGAKP